jgi:hypothetical protein
MRRPLPDLRPAFATVLSAAAGLPDIHETTSYGTPSLSVRGKSFCRLKDADTLVLLCSMEDKELLMEMEPDIFFETDHYKGWPAVLARLSRMGPERLRHELQRAWRQKAPKRLIAEYDRATAKRP